MENMWMKSSVRVKITNQITNLTTTKNVIGNIFGPYHYSCFYHLCTISLSQTQRHMISIHRKVVTRNDLKWPQKYSKTMCHFFSRNAMLKYYRERKREREIVDSIEIFVQLWMSKCYLHSHSSVYVLYFVPMVICLYQRRRHHRRRRLRRCCQRI